MAGSNVRNQGIAHIAFRLGGSPLCKSFRGHIVVTDDNRMGYQICKRCEAKVAKIKARKGSAAASVACEPA